MVKVRVKVRAISPANTEISRHRGSCRGTGRRSASDAVAGGHRESHSALVSGVVSGLSCDCKGADFSSRLTSHADSKRTGGNAVSINSATCSAGTARLKR